MLSTTWLGRAHLHRQVSCMTGERSRAQRLHKRKGQTRCQAHAPKALQKRDTGTVMLSCQFKSAFIPSIGEHQRLFFYRSYSTQSC